VKPLTFKRGLLWRLAAVYGPIDRWGDRTNTNTCTYALSILGGLLACVGIVLFTVVLLMGLIVLPSIMLWYSALVPLPHEFWPLVWALVAVMAVGLAFAVDHWNEFQFQWASQSQGQVALLWRSFRDKACTPITFTENKS
jgi:hypothetical protein